MWFAYAIGASILWGLTYVLSEQIYKRISVGTSLAITCFVTGIVLFLLTLRGGVLKKDIASIMESPNLMKLLIAEIIVFILAELCIALSITHKNATLAGLIEISYPLFIVLFTYLLYRENTLTASAAMGAILIFSGVFVIYFFNR